MTSRDFQLLLGTGRPGAAPSPAERPRLLIIVHDSHAPADARLQRLDRDRLDETIAAIAERVDVQFVAQGALQTATLRIAALDDFDPAVIARQIPVLVQGAALLRDLKEPARAEQAAGELRALLRDDVDLAGAANSSKTGAAPDRNSGSEFARLLGGESGGARPEKSRVEQLVRGLLTSADTGGQPAENALLVPAFLEFRQHILRQALAEPALRSLERRCRAIHWLQSRLDPDEGMELWLVKVNLAAALVPQPQDVARCPLLDMLTAHRRTIDGGQFDMLLTDHEFARPDELQLLGQLAAVADALGSVVLAAAPRALWPAAPGGANADEPASMRSAWAGLRRMPGTHRLAAALPRLLLRLPYGRRGESSDLDGFEELPTDPDHEDFLWGNPAYGLALLMGLCYERDGWPPDLSGPLDIDGMPLPVYADATGLAVKPAAEAYLDDSEAAELAACGVMSFQSIRNRDAVRLSAFYPIAD